MKTCPNCSELVGDNANSCFNCNYNFLLQKVAQKSDSAKIKELEEKKIETERQLQQEMQLLSEQIENIDETRKKTLLYNPYYEYKTEYLYDTKNGFVPKHVLDATLERYSRLGWRLHSMTVNEIKEKSLGVLLSQNIGVGSSNSIDVTILVFERCIKPPSY